MISPKLARLIEFLPEGAVGFFANKLLNHYLNKNARIHIEGMENIDDLQGPILFICNHLSNSDGLVLSRVLKKKDPTFVAGVKLEKDVITKMGFYIVKTTPVVPNTADKEGLAKIIKILRNGENILIFPEGTRSRVGSMIEAKRGLFFIAKTSKAIIVPIGIHGSEKLLPINEDGDMSKESFKSADVYINIGRPFRFSDKVEGEDRKSYEDRVVKEAMYKIAELIPEEYRGVYSKLQ
ncbi:MAG: lysophospholipid acyltransferase family protein [Bacillota bacterium]|nr:lysophospholipid acyltransferase family protein [Bacillota bacterium]